MNAPTKIDRAIGLRADAREQAAQRDLERFLAAYPQVIHAEYCALAGGYTRRVFILRGDTEFEGLSRSTFTDALGDALVKANGGYPKGLPGDGGFIYQHDTGRVIEVRA